jgi:hypothetical protein
MNLITGVQSLNAFPELVVNHIYCLYFSIPFRGTCTLGLIGE